MNRKHIVSKMKQFDPIDNNLNRLTHSIDVVRLVIKMKLERPAEVKTPALFDDDAEILVRRCKRRSIPKMYHLWNDAFDTDKRCCRLCDSVWTDERRVLMEDVRSF